MTPDTLKRLILDPKTAPVSDTDATAFYAELLPALMEVSGYVMTSTPEQAGLGCFDFTNPENPAQSIRFNLKDGSFTLDFHPTTFLRATGQPRLPELGDGQDVSEWAREFAASHLKYAVESGYINHVMDRESTMKRTKECLGWFMRATADKLMEMFHFKEEDTQGGSITLIYGENGPLFVGGGVGGKIRCLIEGRIRENGDAMLTMTYSSSLETENGWSSSKQVDYQILEPSDCILHTDAQIIRMGYRFAINTRNTFLLKGIPLPPIRGKK